MIFVTVKPNLTKRAAAVLKAAYAVLPRISKVGRQSDEQNIATLAIMQDVSPWVAMTCVYLLERKFDSADDFKASVKDTAKFIDYVFTFRKYYDRQLPGMAYLREGVGRYMAVPGNPDIVLYVNQRYEKETLRRYSRVDSTRLRVLMDEIFKVYDPNSDWQSNYRRKVRIQRRKAVPRLDYSRVSRPQQNYIKRREAAAAAQYDWKALADEYKRNKS